MLKCGFCAAVSSSQTLYHIEIHSPQGGGTVEGAETAWNEVGKVRDLTIHTAVGRKTEAPQLVARLLATHDIIRALTCDGSPRVIL